MRFTTVVRNIRYSSSVILGVENNLTRTLKPQNNCTVIDNISSADYSLMMTKRNPKISFGGLYTFPGGIIEKSDFSLWKNKFNPPSIEESSNGFYKEQIADSKDCIHPSVAFKVAAIRELYEECGFLLIPSSESGIKCGLLNIKEADRNKSIQELYNYYSISPPIDRMYPWSLWLSPLELKKRFHTLFYFSSISEIQMNDQDLRLSKEVDNLTLACPTTNLIGQLDGDLKKNLAPPQSFELQRLANYDSLEDLTLFACQRTELGFESLFPRQITTKDTQSRYYVMNGDHYYASEEKTINECDMVLDEDDWQSYNRYQIKDWKIWPGNWWESNCPIDGHALPIRRKHLMHKYSHLYK